MKIVENLVKLRKVLKKNLDMLFEYNFVDDYVDEFKEVIYKELFFQAYNKFKDYEYDIEKLCVKSILDNFDELIKEHIVLFLSFGLNIDNEEGINLIDKLCNKILDNNKSFYEIYIEKIYKFDIDFYIDEILVKI